MVSDRVEELIREVRGPDVLHLGCTGGLMEDLPLVNSPDWIHGQILKQFPDAWGLDLSESKVSFLQQHGIPNLHVGDAESFDLQKQFDTIVAGELIEHLGRPLDLLARARDHLKPDGRLLITTPYVFGLVHVAYAWVKFPKTCSNREHTAWFCPATLSVLAQMSGLRIASWHLLYDLKEGRGKIRFYNAVYEQVRRLLPRRIAANGMLVVLARPSEMDGEG